MAYPNYSFINSEQVTLLLAPTGTQIAYQLTAEEPMSGVIFVVILTQQQYEKEPASVGPYMQAIGEGIHVFSVTPHVVGLTTISQVDQNNNIAYLLQVTVESTSGKSTTQILANYPISDFVNLSIQEFDALIAKTVAELDAVEHS